MSETQIVSVRIAEIFVASPRVRNRKKFAEIVTSIRTVGLKRPITISRRTEKTADGRLYDLVCGQGRMEAFSEIGETEIPSVITVVSREDQFLMSLVENLARRRPSNRGLLPEVKALIERGYGAELIAEKLGIDRVFTYGLVNLIENGEESLVEQVEAGKLPISVAVEIARGNDHAVSVALSDAYQSGQLRGRKLAAVRKMLTARASKRKSSPSVDAKGKQLSAKALVKVYERIVIEQRALVMRAENAKSHILLLASIFQELVADESFVKLLRAESLFDMPESLAERLR